MVVLSLTGPHDNPDVTVAFTTAQLVDIGDGLFRIEQGEDEE
jgi:hypothetical protein